MAESTSSKPGGGCFSKLLLMILWIAAGGFIFAVYSAVQPQDLSDLKSPAAAAGPVPDRDVKIVLRNAIDRGFPVTLQEAEINRWLARTLVGKQVGILEGKVTFDRVWVRFQDGIAEIIMERQVMGKPFTVSMFLQIERLESPQGVFTEIHPNGGPYHPDFPHPPKGGRFGKLVVPQGFVYLVLPAFRKLADQFPAEIELGLREMSRISLEKGRIVLDPRRPLGDQGLPQSF